MHGNLSDDAYFLACSLFSMMKPNDGTVTFRMQESRPTARTQAALDELVARGKLTVRPFNQFGGFVYSPTLAFPRPNAKETKAAGEWLITEKIAGSKV